MLLPAGPERSPVGAERRACRQQRASTAHFVSPLSDLAQVLGYTNHPKGDLSFTAQRVAMCMRISMAIVGEKAET
jgi:hypothetical protein